MDEIKGVIIKNAKIIPDGRGWVRHFVRSDDEIFDKLHRFGEIYFTRVYQGETKAWHGYRTKSMAYTILRGAVKLGLMDCRKGSPTEGVSQTIFLTSDLPQIVYFPPMVFNGFYGIFDSLICICASEPFSEETIIRYPPDHFNYDWK